MDVFGLCPWVKGSGAGRSAATIFTALGRAIAKLALWCFVQIADFLPDALLLLV